MVATRFRCSRVTTLPRKRPFVYSHTIDWTDESRFAVQERGPNKTTQPVEKANGPSQYLTTDGQHKPHKSQFVDIITIATPPCSPLYYHFCWRRSANNRCTPPHQPRATAALSQRRISPAALQHLCHHHSFQTWAVLFHPCSTVVLVLICDQEQSN